MNLDPLDQPVSEINTPLAVVLPIDCEPELFFDCDRFYTHLGREYDCFDVLTYSLSKNSYAPLYNIQRLISNHPLEPTSAIRPKKFRMVVNNHAKLFFCYKSMPTPVGPGMFDVLQCVYLGSQNLTSASQINIMYRADYRHNQPLLNFFNSLWEAAKQNENHNRVNPPRRPTLRNMW